MAKVGGSENVKVQEEQWHTGFWEGDGSAFISAQGQLTVDFSQMERAVLEYIDSLTEGGRFGVGAHNISRLQFYGPKCIPLLAVFARHVVSEHSIRRLAKLSGALEALASHTPTIDWLTGFFDAEGWPGRQPSLAIEQKERDVLDKIVIVFEGSIHLYQTGCYRWCLDGNKARELAHEIVERSHNPSKAERVLEYFSGPTYAESHRERARACTKQYNEEHHEQVKVRHAAYRREHLADTHEYNKQYWAKHKLVEAYIKAHPEVTEKLQNANC